MRLEASPMANDIRDDGDSDRFVDWVELLNKILSVRPGLFGISLNVNAVIEEWVKKSKSRPRQVRYQGRIV